MLQKSTSRLLLEAKGVAVLSLFHSVFHSIIFLYGSPRDLENLFYQLILIGLRHMFPKLCKGGRWKNRTFAPGAGSQKALERTLLPDNLPTSSGHGCFKNRSQCQKEVMNLVIAFCFRFQFINRVFCKRTNPKCIGKLYCQSFSVACITLTKLFVL